MLTPFVRSVTESYSTRSLDNTVRTRSARNWYRSEGTTAILRRNVRLASSGSAYPARRCGTKVSRTKTIHSLPVVDTHDLRRELRAIPILALGRAIPGRPTRNRVSEGILYSPSSNNDELNHSNPNSGADAPVATRLSSEPGGATI